MFGSRRKELARRLGEAQNRIRELEAWKGKTEDLFDRSYVQQMELAGEIMTSLRGGARISHKAFGMLQQMGQFEREFQGASGDLGRIDDQIGELSRSIITTSAAIDQTSAAIEQISASITMISQESSTRFHDIRNLAALSKSGQEEMATTLKVIQDVTSGIDDLRSFLEIIDDIAGKTSILSMNAAIQAAHAGEVGKGFAVVADEVRRLAESSSTNAAAIAKRLNGLIETIHRAEASSLKTSGILTEAEDKVAKATASFQEIQYGTQELAQGGREMLQGVSSLKEVASVLTETGTVIAMNSGAITAKIGSLRSQSVTLESELTALRQESSELNGAGMTLTQSAVKQLAVSRDFQDKSVAMDPTFAAILGLQHLGWVTRVRGVLDGTLQIEGSTLGDHHSCDLGRWLDGPGKTIVPANEYQTITSLHEGMHDQVKRILTLARAPGKQVEAEAEFPLLVTSSESIVKLLQGLSTQGAAPAVLVAWKPEFEVGNRTIDSQHRRLVDLINQLFSALQSGQGRRVLAGVLQELVDYTLTHFRDEEGLFQASTYPGKKAHLEEHKNFVETVSKFQGDFLAGRVVLGSDTVHFLRDWLVKHIMGSDQGYAKYL